MRSFLQKTALVLLSFAGLTSLRAAKVDPLVTSPIWEHKLTDFSDADYRFAVEQMIQEFERTAHRPLVPGAKKKVGIKVYAD